MAAMSDYLEGQIINHVFRDTAYAQPATIAIALCTSEPVDSDTGDLTGKEVSAVDYQRIVVGRGNAKWSDVAAGNGTTLNSLSITWPAALNDWGIIGWVAIVDDATIGAGNLLFHGALAVSETIVTGQVFQFSPTQLGVQIDN